MEMERDRWAAKFLRNLYKSLYRDAKDRNPRRVQGTCEWFTNHDRFQHWKDGKTCGLLWVSADPGCGKSVLSRYLVDEVLPSSSSSTTCYFFFKDNFEDQRSAAGALCCILRQLFQVKPALLQDSILKQFREDGDKLLDSFRDLWRILVSVSRNRESGLIVCIMDALDECKEQDRHLLVETLNDFYLEKGVNTKLKFLVTSRPYANIGRCFDDVQKRFPMIRLRGEGQFESEEIAREIDLVVEARITRLCTKLQLSEPEERVMRREMTRKRNRTYLWVYLVFEVLERSVSHSTTQIEEYFRNIPATVQDAYEKILSKSPDKKKARKLLHMVLAAKRPLTLEEMTVAMTIDSSHTLYGDLNIEREERVCIWVREICGLFVSIVGGKIYLLHQTAAEFLVERVSDGDGQDALLEEDSSRSEWKCSFSPRYSNLILGSVCAQLLLFTDVVDSVREAIQGLCDEILGSLYHLDKKYPLLAYSVEHWAVHLGDASSTKSLPLNNMLQLCCGSESACLVRRPGEEYYRHAKNMTPLVVASILGLAAVTRHLLKLESTDANEGEPMLKGPPLFWAVRAGHKAVFDTFIEAEAHYQKRGRHMKRLFGRFYIDFDAKNKNLYLRPEAVYCTELRDPTTPLGWAVCSGEAYMVVKLLATRRVTVAKEMLFGAAMKDRVDILRALLATGQVRVRCKAENGRRLLNWALKHSAVRVTKYLLDTDKFDVGTEMQPWPGELSGVAYAAKDGADELLRLLLATGKADIDFRNHDSQERSPLSFAAEAGAQDCVRLLLATAQVEIDNRGSSYSTLTDQGLLAGFQPLFINPLSDLGGDTPLMYAAKNGHEGVVRLLLDTGKAGINTATSALVTPLAYAADGGHERVVKQLLATGKAMANSRDLWGRTPLSHAAGRGHEGVVRELLTAGEVIVNDRDTEERTSLSYAAERGHERVVKQLLAAGNAMENFRDCRGKTPLSYAAKNGHGGIVWDLLATNQEVVDCMDSEKRTPLSYAAEWGHEEIVQHLVATGKVNIDSMDDTGKTPLSHAAEKGHEGVVQQLLVTGEADVNSMDNLGKTPLYHAAEEGHEGVARQLLAMKADANVKDRDGQAPLFAAVSKRQEGCANRLLTASGTDVDTKNNEGKTPLALAVESRMENMVRNLLATDRVDVNVIDCDGRTILAKAIGTRNYGVIEALLETRRVIVTPDCWESARSWSNRGYVDIDDEDWITKRLNTYGPR